MKTIILSDLHNRAFKTRQLFTEIGLMDEDGNRADGFHVIQLGDALSLGYGEQEAEFFQWLEEFVDEWLIGNHELPALWFDPWAVMFGGWEGRDIVAEQMVRNKFVSGGYKVATSVGKWLVSHAGVSHFYLKQDFKDLAEPEDIATALNEGFEAALLDRHPVAVYAAIPFIRGGSHQYGSVFWEDFKDLKQVYEMRGGAARLPQVVGHSGHYGPKMWAPNLWCIDTAPSQTLNREFGGVAGIVTEDDGETWHLHYVPAD